MDFLDCLFCCSSNYVSGVNDSHFRFGICLQFFNGVCRHDFHGEVPPFKVFTLSSRAMAAKFGSYEAHCCVCSLLFYTS